MRQQRNILREIAKNNRGSGIVTVLVCMLCVALMGAAMLSMSYTGLRIKVAQRQAEKDFYSAETAVEEIRAGLQGLVSEAIGEAYREVLINYNDGANVVSRFQEKFRDILRANNSVFSATELIYRVNGLQGFVSGSAVVSGNNPTNNETGTLVWNEVNNTLTLKGVKVSYAAADGYVTEIETDLVIGMPDFAYVMSTYSISGLPEHALIAKDALVQTIGNSLITIDGSAYAGSIKLSGQGSQLTLTDGTMVCAGLADITNNAGENSETGRFTVDDSAKFWAERIVVNGGSSVVLGGETYVLDDLDLSGTGATATLRGSYYGFGNGTPDSGTGPKAEYSSAILVNGSGSTLDMSGLNRLMLAGRSFISNTFFASETVSSGVETLESVSVRSNQQMYLMPVEYLKDIESNPHIHAPESNDSNTMLTAEGTEGQAADQSGDQSEDLSTGQSTDQSEDQSEDLSYLLTTEGAAMLAKYKASLKSLTAVLPGAGNQQITYYFINFTDKNAANDYFEDYFASHSENVNSYLTDASNLNAGNSGAAGYTLRGSDGSYTVSHSGGISFDCTSMRSTFNQLKKTLIDSNTSATATNPYDYIVDTDKVAAVTGTQEFKVGEETVGLVVNNENTDPYTVNRDNTRDTVRLIIASGDVTVEENFTGLIICGGTITISGNVDVTADEDGVVAAFEGTANGEKLGTYLLHGGTQTGGSGGSGGSAAGWNLDQLVTYRNWTKNG